MTGPIRRLSQCHPTITNSYSYSWIRNQMFLLIHFEIQESWVIITTNTQTQPENFQEILQISRISRRKNNSSRYPGFPGVLDTLIFTSQLLFLSTQLSMSEHWWHLYTYRLLITKHTCTGGKGDPGETTENVTRGSAGHINTDHRSSSSITATPTQHITTQLHGKAEQNTIWATVAQLTAWHWSPTSAALRQTPGGGSA